jgi:hypothetical protein
VTKVRSFLSNKVESQSSLVNRLDHLKIATRKLVEERALLTSLILELHASNELLMEALNRKDDVSDLGIIFDLLKTTHKGKSIISSKLSLFIRDTHKKDNSSEEPVFAADKKVFRNISANAHQK